MSRRLFLTLAVLCAVVLGGAVLVQLLPASSPVPTPSATAEPDAIRTVAATGVRVIDGDTLDVKLDGHTVRVRLLNVDAPETAHDGNGAQCLSAEARKWLTRVAGKGTKLKLATYGKDRFGRTLGGLYDDTGRLLNAELVGAGLAAPFVVNRQVDLIDPVRAAQLEAARAGAGLHASAGCTVPGRLGRLEKALAALPLDAADRAAAAQGLAKAESARTELDGLATDLAGNERNALVDGLTEGEVAALRDRLGLARARLAAVTTALQAQV